LLVITHILSNLIGGNDSYEAIINYENVFYETALRYGFIEENDLVSPNTKKQNVKDFLIKKNQENIWTEIQGLVYGKAIIYAKPYKNIDLFLEYLKEENHEYYIVSHKTKYTYNFYIEIPAGTKEKWEVEKETGVLKQESKNGKPRIIKFLPYPGNYGFIPQTLAGDGDPIDVIDLDEGLNRGITKEIHIIGGLYFEDKKEEDVKLVGIGKNSNFSKYEDINELLIEKPNVLNIIKQWFESYKKPGKMIFYRFMTKEESIKIIEEGHNRWSKKNN